MCDLSKTGIRSVVIAEIRELAKKYGVQRVVLFGSRARGDHHEKSDIDLAIRGGQTGLFRVAVNEETGTLLRYDIVDMDRAVSAELEDVIESEGILIYEKV